MSIPKYNQFNRRMLAPMPIFRPMDPYAIPEGIKPDVQKTNNQSVADSKGDFKDMLPVVALVVVAYYFLKVKK